jgi:hypothetical protein
LSSIFTLDNDKRNFLRTVQSVKSSLNKYNFDKKNNLPKVNFNFMMSWIFNYHIPILTIYVEAALKILNGSKVKNIISADFSDPRVRVFTALANKMGIQTIDVQFGMLEKVNSNFEWGFCRSKKISVWGEYASKELIAAGIPAQNIFITGSPKHDYIKEYFFNSFMGRQSDYESKGKKPIVLFASAYEPIKGRDHNAATPIRHIKESVVELTQAHPDIEFIVKPHPLEDEVDLQRLFSECSNVTVLSRREEIRKYIKECDIFIGLGTAATIDAILLGKKIICPRYQDFYLNDIFIESGCGIEVKNLSELIASVVFRQDDPRKSSVLQNRFIKDISLPVDGLATKRLAKLCME